MSEEPLWFNLLEPIGMIIALWAYFYAYNNFRKFGGLVGKSYSYITAMLMLAILTFFFRSLIEFELVPETLLTQAIFELMLYGQIMLIAIGSWTVSKSMK